MTSSPFTPKPFKPKIVWLAQGHEGYGVAAAICNLMSAASENGWHCELVLMRHGQLEERALCAGLSTTVLDAGKPLRMNRTGIARLFDFVNSIFRAGENTTALIKHLKFARADAIHIIPHMMLLPGVLAGRATNTRVVWEMAQIISESYPLGINKRLYQLLCRFGRVTVLANSAYSGASVAGLGVNPITFHLGIDPVAFNNSGYSIERASIGLDDNAVVFAIAGRLVPIKGQLMVIEALLPLFKTDDIQLLLLGGPHKGSYYENLRSLIKKHNISKQVVMIDQVTDPQTYLRTVDIVVNGRLTPEPFGLSIIEAMMLGKPVLATDIGGPAETIQDGKTGWLSPAATVEEFRSTLQRVLSMRDLWPQMGTQAMNLAQQRFTRQAQFERYKRAIRY